MQPKQTAMGSVLQKLNEKIEELEKAMEDEKT